MGRQPAFSRHTGSPRWAARGPSKLCSLHRRRNSEADGMIASFGSPPAHKSTPDQRAPSALSGLAVVAAAARATTHPLMATCSRHPPPPSFPPPRFLLRSHRPLSPLASRARLKVRVSSRRYARFLSGMKGGPPVPAPEEEMKVKPPAGDIARPGSSSAP